MAIHQSEFHLGTPTGIGPRTDVYKFEYFRQSRETGNPGLLARRDSRPRTGADLRRAITMEDADYAEI